MSKSQIALAGRVKPGDVVVVDGVAKAVVRIKRAQGRKPAKGENLYLVTEDDDVVRINSNTGIRIMRQT